MTKEEIKAICGDPELFVQHFRRKLQAHTPQTFAYRSDVRGTPAAVMFPFYFKNDQSYLLLTRRSDLVEHHKGQISLPGGSKDAEDADLLQTALRETEEEIGLKPQDIQVLGQTDRFLTNSHYCVTPFVGLFAYPYRFKISEAEIDYLIEVPLLHLLDDAHYETKISSGNGTRWILHYYYFKNEVIWGVTGFLLSNLFSIAFDLNRNQFLAQEAAHHA